MQSLRPSQRRYFESILNMTATKDEVMRSLYKLTLFLTDRFRRSVIVLIDEYADLKAQYNSYIAAGQISVYNPVRATAKANLIGFLAGGPKLIYYSKSVTRHDSPSRRS